MYVFILYQKATLTLAKQQFTHWYGVYSPKINLTGFLRRSLLAPLYVALWYLRNVQGGCLRNVRCSHCRGWQLNLELNFLSSTVTYARAVTMAACASALTREPMARLVGRLLWSSGASCPARSAARAFSCGAAARSQKPGTGGALPGRVDRFGGVTVNLADVRLPADISEAAFSRLLHG